MCAQDISHAIAYCETFMMSPDPGEMNELELIKASSTIPVDSAVSVLKETVSRKGIIGSDTILKEMNSPEFKRYLVRFMNCE